MLGGLGSNPHQDFTAQWETVAVIHVSSTGVPAKFTALFTSLGCRQSYAFYRANIHTPCWWWHFMSSALQKFCVVCHAHGFLWEEIFAYFPLSMNWAIPTLLSIITPLIRAVPSWQDLPRQEYILLTVGCAGFNSKGEPMIFHSSHYFSTHQILLGLLWSKCNCCCKVFPIHMAFRGDLSILQRTGGMELAIVHL